MQVPEPPGQYTARAVNYLFTASQPFNMIQLTQYIRSLFLNSAVMSFISPSVTR
mgnify:CR=1 FL=1